MLYILTILVLILCILDYVFNYNKNALLLRKIPGGKNYFLIGNALEIFMSPDKLFYEARDWARKYGQIYRLKVFSIATIHISGPDDIEVVLSSMKHHEKSALYGFLKPWLRSGLLLSDGKKWQQRRKILTNAFHFNVLRQYFTIFQENGHRLIDTIRKQSDETVDVVPIVSEFTLNSLCESAMGTQLNEGATDAGKSYKEALHGLGSILVKRLVKFYFYPDMIFNLSYLRWAQSKYLSIMHDFTDSVIKSRKKAIKNNEVQSIDINEDVDEDLHLTSKKKKVAMLDLLIAAEAEGTIDKEGIQEEVDTFTFEGHDTSSTGLAYALVSIANYPKVQEKILAELRTIFGETKRVTTEEDLNKMQYLERCIKESMRLYPPVPFIGRKLSETVTLSNYVVPAGTLCHILIYDLHRRADLYENPLHFDPDRFLPENCMKRHNFAYLPFSAGPRNCIGQKFAMMEMKLALSEILRNFELHPVTTPTDLKFTADIILRNTKPVYVKFSERKK